MRKNVVPGLGRLVVITAAGALLGVASPTHAATILVDFGTDTTQTNSLDASGRRWNNVHQGNDLSGNPFALQATTDTASGYTLTVSNPPGVTNAVGFNSNNTNGANPATGSAAALGYPSTATQDSLYGNTVAFNGTTVQSVRLTLSNLDPNQRYAFTFFASRTAVAAPADNRETEYLITGGPAGAASGSLFLDATNNTSNVVSAGGFAPDANNQIVIDLDPGPNNNNSNQFFYINTLEINSNPVPEPAGLAAVALGGVSLLGRHRRRHG